MDWWIKHVIMAVFLLFFCELIESNGVCRFARMFPPREKNTCFNDKILEEIRKHCYNDKTLKEDKVTTQESTNTPCPLNMDFGNCTCGATCEDPTGQHGCYNNCTEGETCVCPEDFLIKEEHCVPRNRCRCFISEAGKVLSIKESFVTHNCSSRCVCRENELVCEKDGFVGNGQECTLVLPDCYDIFKNGSRDSGIYTIYPNNWTGSPFQVYCNMDNGGGWTVFQRRVDGSVDFNRTWEDYKKGFGFLSHEVWLGNRKISYLTSQADYELRIDFVNKLGSSYYATYDLFRIGNEDDNYTLTLGTYGGTANYDSLDNHRGYPFSTPDGDNDANKEINCGQYYHSGWWFDKCLYSDLNGVYNATDTNGITWESLPGSAYHIKYTEMKIRLTER